MCSLRGTPQKTKLCILFYILYLLLISFLARGNLNDHSCFWCVVACMTTWQSSRWVVAAFVQQFIDTSRFFNIKKHRKTFSALPSPKLPKSELKSAKTKILFLSFVASFFKFFFWCFLSRLLYPPCPHEEASTSGLSSWLVPMWSTTILLAPAKPLTIVLLPGLLTGPFWFIVVVLLAG